MPEITITASSVNITIRSLPLINCHMLFELRIQIYFPFLSEESIKQLFFKSKGRSGTCGFDSFEICEGNYSEEFNALFKEKEGCDIGVTSSNVRFDAKGGIVAYVCACTLRSAYAGDSSHCCELFV